MTLGRRIARASHVAQTTLGAKGPLELPCGDWEGRPTHARGEGSFRRSRAGRPGVSRVTKLRHVRTHTPQRLSLLLELDVGLGHGLGEVARAARLLQQRQQVRAVQYARGGVLPDRKRPAREESPQPLHGGRRTQPGIQRLPCRAASAGPPSWQWGPCLLATRAEGATFAAQRRAYPPPRAAPDEARRAPATRWPACR